MVDWDMNKAVVLVTVMDNIIQFYWRDWFRWWYLVWILSMAPASLTDFHSLFSVPSSKCCSSTLDRLWPLPSMCIPVHYAPACHCLMMDTDTDTIEWLQYSHFVYNVLWCWQTGEWEFLTAGNTPQWWILKCVPCTVEKCIFCWTMKLCCRDFTPSTFTQN